LGQADREGKEKAGTGEIIGGYKKSYAIKKEL
jgi:hypothetical protein